jgi:hypothetical protein
MSNSIRRKCCCGSCCSRTMTIAGWAPRDEYFGMFGGSWHWLAGTVNGTFTLDVIEGSGPAWNPSTRECHSALARIGVIDVGRYVWGEGSALIDVPDPAGQIDHFDVLMELYQVTTPPGHMVGRLRVISQGSYIAPATISQIYRDFLLEADGNDQFVCPLPKTQPANAMLNTWQTCDGATPGVYGPDVMADQILPWGDWSGMTITVEAA